MSPLQDVKTIVNMLTQRIEPLCRHILPAGQKEGQEWRVGSCLGEKGKSMAVHLTGSRAGVWQDFAAGIGGDALDLVAAVKCNGQKADAIKWCRGWLGLADIDPRTMKKINSRAEEDRKRRAADAERERQARAKVAKALWIGAEDFISGTPVAHYLRGRGIELLKLKHFPRSLRFAPDLAYPPDLNDGVVASFPAMVACIVNARGEYLATHRTFLKPAGRIACHKAPVKEAKLSLGSFRGGFIPLSRGKTNKRLSENPKDDWVILCEGIEDGLSLCLLYPDARVLACISVSNFQNITLPDGVTRVTLARDNDAPGSAADQAVERALMALQAPGRRVELIAAPAPYKDFNAALIGYMSGHARQKEVAA
jgi:hypothetical protein